ncbi:MAG: glutamyl-tRNA reductase [Candidatus Eremiobacteraeota bacterium]|nr:glutamyl-tRNA reductase [Candidatus Eremiobacteraeota bacterium]MBV9055297.1 glutamyl-tRNA reductase [Candidatus Eremiobacteraeota bacterium]MBV9698971.1 glutamyl-tRNA reductase [Candidatus Eremiobacteraeota bacterium]
MPITCIGLSHHTAPVEVRERHTFPTSRMAEALVALRDYEAVQEAVMLQTCGRLEIYAELDDYERGVTQIKSFLANFRHGATGYDLESYLYTHLGHVAVEHLFRVCTGLDSMLIGEAEVLGQVKDAYVAGAQAKSLGRTLHRLFHDALAAGKTARAQTRIGSASASIATAAVAAARCRLGSLEDKSVLVVGAGKMGKTAVRRLRSEGAARVIVANRTLSRSRDLVAEAGFGEAIEMPGLVEAIALADVVVASTGASHFILNHERVAAAMERRSDRPLFIVDIAVPRDADPIVATIPNVSLVDIDGLKALVDQRLEERREAIPAVEEIIAEYVERFERWYRQRSAVPVIARLTQKAEAIRAAELERLLTRCPNLDDRERMLVTGMTMTIVSKLLHSAILKIREKATTGEEEALSNARVLDELFDLGTVADVRE